MAPATARRPELRSVATALGCSARHGTISEATARSIGYSLGRRSCRPPHRASAATAVSRPAGSQPQQGTVISAGQPASGVGAAARGDQRSRWAAARDVPWRRVDVTCGTWRQPPVQLTVSPGGTAFRTCAAGSRPPPTWWSCASSGQSAASPGDRPCPGPGPEIRRLAPPCRWVC